MGTSTGARCGTHCLRSSFSKCRLCLIRAMTRDEKRKEGFMAVSLEVMTDWNMHPVQLRKKRHFRYSNSGKYELFGT